MVLGKLLDRLRGIRTIHDPAFGTLRTFGPGSWEGVVPFAATGDELDVLLDAGPDGPTTEQQRFPPELAQRYPALLTEVERVLHAAGAQEPADVRLVAIDVPVRGAGRGNFELTYESRELDLYSILFTDWRPRLLEPEAF